MCTFDARVLAYDECRQLNRADGDEHPYCSRCDAVLHTRCPNSLARTWALLITAATFYIPANLLPIMTVSLFGSGTPATIMEGVAELVRADMFPIALVVFVASILVPTFKLVSTALSLYSVQRRQPISTCQCILMYRFIGWIGRWSILGILVIAIPMVLANFGSLINIEAGFGAVAFISVMVLTMSAVMMFNPRLIWNNTNLNDEGK